MDIDLGRFALSLFTIIFSVTVHEFAHAWTAHKMGDDTAARQGRLTLNPMPLMQAEPIGMVVAPLLGAWTGFKFAWASTPVDLRRVARRFSMRQANFWISLAGPLSNLLLAVLSVVLLAFIARGGHASNPDLGEPLLLIAQQLAITNLTLFFFNLIPVAPLDGFSVLFSALPRSFERLEAIVREYGGMLLIVVMLIGARLISPLVKSAYLGLLGLAGLL